MSLVLPDIESLTIVVEERLPENIFAHSIRVAETAHALASLHCPSEARRVRVASVLHDIAKPMSDCELLSLSDKFGILSVSIERRNPRLLHAPVGAEIAHREFGVTDDAVLSAIRWHTVGLRGMPACAMILYIADATEPEREFEGVEGIRAASERSLAEGCALRAASTVAYVMKMGWELDIRTLEFYNSLVDAEGTR